MSPPIRQDQHGRNKHTPHCPSPLLSLSPFSPTPPREMTEPLLETDWISHAPPATFDGGPQTWPSLASIRQPDSPSPTDARKQAHAHCRPSACMLTASFSNSLFLALLVATRLSRSSALSLLPCVQLFGSQHSSAYDRVCNYVTIANSILIAGNGQYGCRESSPFGDSIRCGRRFGLGWLSGLPCPFYTTLPCHDRTVVASHRIASHRIAHNAPSSIPQRFQGGLTHTSDHQIFLYSNELAERGVKKMEKKNVVFTKDGARVGVKEVTAEEYADKTQKAFVNTWNAAHDGGESVRERGR
ncbi:predicted protein [Plenodomus lingam JN3]|uniref:Predicted protein n=1 Tax=Leptosphaeria maculans (strain JN3 / isolate v23.1.3 / race Av1-4-5-6-7-8) TaxID=985895 RepID=E4ZSD5_LEPMJ|nr:predicted protein [Plenodomus lingam JN3]CBX94315.1 predicted protein [Plenodomus lingam JN3]